MMVEQHRIQRLSFNEYETNSQGNVIKENEESPYFSLLQLPLLQDCYLCLRVRR